MSAAVIVSLPRFSPIYAELRFDTTPHEPLIFAAALSRFSYAFRADFAAALSISFSVTAEHFR